MEKDKEEIKKRCTRRRKIRRVNRTRKGTKRGKMKAEEKNSEEKENMQRKNYRSGAKEMVRRKGRSGKSRKVKGGNSRREDK
jgi:hypothetical protein